jgi:hypothetical protein
MAKTLLYHPNTCRSLSITYVRLDTGVKIPHFRKSIDERFCGSRYYILLQLGMRTFIDLMIFHAPNRPRRQVCYPDSRHREERSGHVFRRSLEVDTTRREEAVVQEGVKGLDKINGKQT